MWGEFQRQHLNVTESCLWDTEFRNRTVRCLFSLEAYAFRGMCARNLPETNIQRVFRTTACTGNPAWKYIRILKSCSDFTTCYVVKYIQICSLINSDYLCMVNYDFSSFFKLIFQILSVDIYYAYKWKANFLFSLSTSVCSCVMHEHVSAHGG